MYWNWGPIYVNDIKAMKDGTWKAGSEYFDVDSGGLGLYGFMEGQKPQPGVPADVIPQVQAVLKDAQAGKFNRFSVFSGEIKDNKGNVVIPAGQHFEQCDIDQFKPGTDQCPAKYGMYWWNQNFIAELPKLSQ
jgi:basic membrane protein A